MACGGKTKRGVTHRCDALLLLDDRNEHDNQAVRVLIGGRTVGHLSRHDARAYRARLKQAGTPRVLASVQAEIRGGWDKGQGNQGAFGVFLDLPVND